MLKLCFFVHIFCVSCSRSCIKLSSIVTEVVVIFNFYKVDFLIKSCSLITLTSFSKILTKKFCLILIYLHNFRSRIEARRMTCFCDIRVGGHSNSKVLYDAHDSEVRGTFKGCRAGTNECPGKCWNEVKKALDNRNVLNDMCRHYTTVKPPNGIPLVGYVTVSYTHLTLPTKRIV